MKQPIICDVLVNPSQITCDVVGIQVFILSHALLKSGTARGCHRNCHSPFILSHALLKKKSGTARGKGGSNLGLQPTMEVPYHSASSVVTLESLRFR